MACPFEYIMLEEFSSRDHDFLLLHYLPELLWRLIVCVFVYYIDKSYRYLLFLITSTLWKRESFL